jgi:hypothetical protein
MSHRKAQISTDTARLTHLGVAKGYVPVGTCRFGEWVRGHGDRLLRGDQRPKNRKGAKTPRATPSGVGPGDLELLGSPKGRHSCGGRCVVRKDVWRKRYPFLGSVVMERAMLIAPVVFSAVIVTITVPIDRAAAEDGA